MNLKKRTRKKRKRIENFEIGAKDKKSQSKVKSKTERQKEKDNELFDFELKRIVAKFFFFLFFLKKSLESAFVGFSSRSKLFFECFDRKRREL